MNVKGNYHLLSKKMEVTIATKPEIKFYTSLPSLEKSSVFHPDEKVTHKPEGRHPRTSDRNSTSIDGGLNCWASACPAKINMKM